MVTPRHAATKDTRIFLVDDEPLVRRGLRLLVSCEPRLAVCGEASGVDEALRKIPALRPDLAVIDLTLNGRDGTGLIRRLHHEFPALRILVFSLHDELELVTKALQAGARGYVNKEEGADTIVEAIGRLAQGGRYLSQKITARLPALRRWL
jgi:two-component system, NarL family, nitrate/nitrite response regulator NarL